MFPIAYQIIIKTPLFLIVKKLLEHSNRLMFVDTTIDHTPSINVMYRLV